MCRRTATRRGTQSPTAAFTDQTRAQLQHGEAPHTPEPHTHSPFSRDTLHPDQKHPTVSPNSITQQDQPCLTPDQDVPSILCTLMPSKHPELCGPNPQVNLKTSLAPPRTSVSWSLATALDLCKHRDQAHYNPLSTRTMTVAEAELGQTRQDRAGHSLHV